MSAENSIEIKVVNCKVNHVVVVKESSLPAYPLDDIFRVPCNQIESSVRKPIEHPAYRFKNGSILGKTVVCEAGDCTHCNVLYEFK